MRQGANGPGNNHVKAVRGLFIDWLAWFKSFYSGSHAIDMLQMQVSAELP
jgi:hypothetical protein